jgi:peptidoglycan/xylan/chitin deacetylase (PgdA/CDA1 family)
MFQYLRKIFFTTLYFAGIGALLKYYNTKRYFVPILLFHRVSNNHDPYWPPLSIYDFKKIIDFFSAKYTIRPLKDLFRYSPDELKGSCFIVFDDAYKDFLENALPLLREKNIPVTMFVPVESIRTGKPIWTTWLNMCIDQSKTKTLNISSGEYDISSKTAKIRTAHLLIDWLKSLSYQEFRSDLNKIIKLVGESTERSDIAVMNWKEISETNADVDYQSHTMTHPMLGNIDKPEILDYEIGDPKKIIEEEIKRPIQYISYPIGSYSTAVLKKSSEYYDAGFAVDGKLADLKKINDPEYRYRIPRLNISDSDPYELFFRVNGFHKLLGR